MNKFKGFLNVLTVQGINISELKPYEEHMKEIIFYFIDGYLIIKLKGLDN